MDEQAGDERGVLCWNSWSSSSSFSSCSAGCASAIAEARHSDEPIPSWPTIRVCWAGMAEQPTEGMTKAGLIALGLVDFDGQTSNHDVLVERGGFKHVCARSYPWA